MNKKGQVTIWVIIAMFLVGAVIAAVMMWGMWEPTNKVFKCQIDYDCAPATCYDPNECVPVALIEYPSRYYCLGVNYTEECFKETARQENEGDAENPLLVTYFDVEHCSVTNNCVFDCTYKQDEPRCTILPDCDSVIYTPDCALAINLDCGGTRGKCICDVGTAGELGRNTCRVEMP